MINEKKEILKIENEEKFILEFLKRLKEELATQRISETSYQTFRKYYLKWDKDFNEIRKYYYLGRLLPLVNLITKNKIKQVLDIGCGCGSEAILCSLLNCQVVGIDLNKERIDCARERKKYYENLLRKKLNVDFLIGDFNEINLEKNFELVWMNETIHHIEPPLEVLKKIYNHLIWGGWILIADINGFNLINQVRLFFLRGIKLHIKITDPLTGKSISYGNENILTPWQIKKMLNISGFEVEKILYQGFFPPIKLMEKFWKNFKNLENLLSKTPIFKNFGRDYIIIGRKIKNTKN